MCPGVSDNANRARRADAARNRDAILATALGQLRHGDDLSMQNVARAAGISRSTLYRHFATRGSLEAALREETARVLEDAIRAVTRADAPPFAVLRNLVEATVGVAARHELAFLRACLDAPGIDVAPALIRLMDRIRMAAEVEPALPPDLARDAAHHFVHVCLAAGSRASADPRPAVERVVREVTEPLDRALVLVDPDGRLVAANRDGIGLLAPGAEIEPGERLVEPRGAVEVLFEDGSQAPAERYPLRVAVKSGEPQRDLVRGHRGPWGIRWISVSGYPLRSPTSGAVYAVLGVFTDVSPEKDWERSELRPAGRLGSARVPLDIARILDEIPPHLFPEQLVSEARRLTGSPVALYVLDIDGTYLLRLAGAEEFPARLAAPLALGPELAEDGLPDLEAELSRELPGVAVAPMWLRGRAIGLLLALRSPGEPLAELARHGAAALELAGGYTDVIDAARRRKGTKAAAELQQSLIPPRIARIGGGIIAGGVLPSYGVGGDWFDYVENRDGAWLAIADAAGKGATASALGGIALAALRSARRGEQGLEEAVRVMHEVVADVGRPEFFVTAIVMRWHAVYSSLSWINCGHPPPLVVRPDNSIEQLAIDGSLPLGVMERERRFVRRQRRLQPGELLILHSDGITARRTADGIFGLEGIEKAVSEASSRSATAIAKSIQEAVMSASEDPLQDDAVVVALAPEVSEPSDQVH